MSPRVVVVGGGLAGITAALTAADEGAEVTLVEAHHRLGGRTWSFERGGYTFDNGQHVFLRCCTNYLAFLERIDAAHLVELQPRLDLPVLAPAGRPARLRRVRLPAPFHLGPTLARYRHLGLGDRLRLGPAALALRRLDPDDPTLDRTTFGDWLAGHGQSPAAIDELWDLIVRPTVNLPAAEASLALAVKVFRTGLLDDAGAADLGWAREPLSVVHGEASARALAKAGVDVRLGVRVGAVEVGADAVGGVTLVGPERRRGAGEPLPADAVVVAVPPVAAARLLGDHAPHLAEPRLAPLGVSPIVNVQVVLDRRVTDLPVAAVVRSPVQFVFDRSGAAGATGGRQCLVSSVSAATAEINRPAVELVAEQVEALETLFPAARHARLVDAVVTRERQATFRGGPGSAALRPGPTTPVAGLTVAGAWTDTGWPETMESAVRSGHAAATAALAHARSELQARGRNPGAAQNHTTEVPA